jgi:hypothetical protein
VEADYLAVIGNAVSLSDWREIVSRALADAKAGDPKARAWLAKYLIGDTPGQLLDLAADDLLGRSIEDRIAVAARRIQDKAVQDAKFAALFGEL